MSQKKKITVKDIAYIGLFVAIITICAWINIPLVIPFTLQTFAMFCAALLLGATKGTISVLVYLLVGLIGVPVYSGFRSGPGALLGATGGYLIGFIFIPLIGGFLIYKFGSKIWIEVLSLIIGLLICYAFGTAWYIYGYTATGGTITLFTALKWCVIPYLIPDLVKLALALLISHRVKVALRNKE